MVNWWRNRSYWLKGGVIAIPIYLIIAPATFFLVLSLGGGDDIIQFLGPEVFAAMWAFVGDPAIISAHMPQIILGLIQLAVIFIGRVFLLGAIAGKIYEWFAKRGKKTWFWLLLVLTYIVLVAGLTYRTQDLSKTYYSAKAPEECKSALRAGVSNFNINECYRQLAERTKDLAVCDKITGPGPGTDTADAFRGFCYEEVAHAMNDGSICDRIPAAMHGSPQTSSRADACYVWFGMCDKIHDVGWRDSCWQGRAKKEGNAAFCDNMSNRNQYVTRGYCLQQMQRN